MWQNKCDGIGLREAERDAGVSHHTFRNSLLDEFAGIRALSDLAWILESCRHGTSHQPLYR